MSLQQAQDLLSSENPSIIDLQKAINSLHWEIAYIQNSVTVGMRESASATEPVEALRECIKQLEQKQRDVTPR